MKTIIVKLSSGLDLIGQVQDNHGIDDKSGSLILNKPQVLQLVPTPRGVGLNMSPFRLFGDNDYSITILRQQYLDVYNPPPSIVQEYQQLVSGIVVAPASSSIIRA